MTNSELSRDPTWNSCVTHHSRTRLRLFENDVCRFVRGAVACPRELSSTIAVASFFKRVRAKIGEADESQHFRKTIFAPLHTARVCTGRFPNSADDAPAAKRQCSREVLVTVDADLLCTSPHISLPSLAGSSLVGERSQGVLHRRSIFIICLFNTSTSNWY